MMKQSYVNAQGNKRSSTASRDRSLKPCLYQSLCLGTKEPFVRSDKNYCIVCFENYLLRYQNEHSTTQKYESSLKVDYTQLLLMLGSGNVIGIPPIFDRIVDSMNDVNLDQDFKEVMPQSSMFGIPITVKVQPEVTNLCAALTTQLETFNDNVDVQQAIKSINTLGDVVGSGKEKIAGIGRVFETLSSGAKKITSVISSGDTSTDCQLFVIIVALAAAIYYSDDSESGKTDSDAEESKKVNKLRSSLKYIIAGCCCYYAYLRINKDSDIFSLTSLFTIISNCFSDSSDNKENVDIDMEAIPQGVSVNVDGKFMTPLVDLLLTVLGVSDLVTGTHKINFFKTMRETVGMRNNLMEYIKSVVSSCSELINTASRAFGSKENLVIMESGSFQIDDLLKRHNELMVLHASQALYVTVQNLERVTTLLNELEGVVMHTKQTQYTVGALRLVHNAIKDLNILKQELTTDGIDLGGYRFETALIMVRSAPGVGKASVAQFLAGYCVYKNTTPAEFESFIEQKSEFIHTRAPENEYFDGLTSKHIVVMYDEFGQVRDIAGQTPNQYLELIRGINAFPYHLHCSAINEKKKNFWRAKYMIGLTNQLHNFQVESINSKEAVERRIDLDILLKIKPEYATPEGKLNSFHDEIRSQGVGPHMFDFMVRSGKNSSGEILYSTNSWEDITRRIDVIQAKKESILNTNVTRLDHFLSSLKKTTTVSMQSAGKIPKFQYTLFRNDEILEYSVKHGVVLNMKLIDEMRTKIENHFDNDNSLELFETKEQKALLSQLREILPHSKNANYPLWVVVHFLVSRVEDIPAAFEQMTYRENLRAPVIETCEDDRFELAQTFFPVAPHEAGIDPQIIPHFRKKWEWVNNMLTPSQLENLVNIMYAFSGHSGYKRYYSSFTIFCNVMASCGDTCINEYVRTNGQKIPCFLLARELPLVKIATKIPLREFIPNILRDVYVKAKYTFLLLTDGLYDKFINFVSQHKWLLLSISTPIVLYSVFHTLFPSLDTGQSAGRGHSRPNRSKMTIKDAISKHQLAKSKENTIPQGITPTTQQQLGDKLERTSVSRIEVDGNHIGYITFIVGRIGVIPMHIYFDLLECGSQKVSFIRVSNSSVLELSMEDFKACWIPGNETQEHNDLCFLEFPYGSMQRYPDIRDCFLTNDDIRNFRHGVPVTISLAHRNTTIATNASIPKGGIAYVSAFDVRFAIHHTATYIGDTRAGDCGALLTLNRNDSYKRIIVGQHIALGKDKKSAFCSIITQEIIAEILKDIDVSEPCEVVTQSALIPNFLSHFEILETDVKPANNTGGSTEILRSPLYYFEGYHIPLTGIAQTQLRHDHNPWVSAYKKTEMVHVDCNVELTERTIDDMWSFLQQVSDKPETTPLLTFEEALFGAEDCDIRGFRAKPSEGYPYKFTHKGLRKSILGENMGLYPEKEAIVKKLVDDMITAYKNKERPFVIYTDNLKDERRKISKVKEPRLYRGAPFIYNIVIAMYFGKFISWLRENRIANETTVGINCYSDEWDTLCRRQRSLGIHSTEKGYLGNHFDGDFSKFDINQHAWVHNALLEGIIIPFYEDATDEDNDIRRAIFRDISFSRHIFGSIIYESKGGNPSGNRLTTQINDLYNMFSMRYCFYAIPQISHLNFNEHVMLNTHGDDQIVAVSNTIKDYYNLVTLGPLMMDLLGLKYTSGTKEDIEIPFKPFSEIVFLKRKFVPSSIIHLWTAPLDLDTVLEICQWTKKSNAKGIFLDNVRETLRELALHPQEIYERYQKILIDFVKTQYSGEVLDLDMYQTYKVAHRRILKYQYYF